MSRHEAAAASADAFLQIAVASPEFFDVSLDEVLEIDDVPLEIDDTAAVMPDTESSGDEVPATSSSVAPPLPSPATPPWRQPAPLPPPLAEQPVPSRSPAELLSIYGKAFALGPVQGRRANLTDSELLSLLAETEVSRARGLSWAERGPPAPTGETPDRFWRGQAHREGQQGGVARWANRGGRHQEYYSNLAKAGRLRPTPGGDSISLTR
jgi:hypothetical protein